MRTVLFAKTVDALLMIYLARGIEDDHFWVAEEIDGTLVETPWRIEHEADGYLLSHADNSGETAPVHELGPFSPPRPTIDGLGALLG